LLSATASDGFVEIIESDALYDAQDASESLNIANFEERHFQDSFSLQQMYMDGSTASHSSNIFEPDLHYNSQDDFEYLDIAFDQRKFGESLHLLAAPESNPLFIRS
jgi:hypothetical protein